MHVYVRITLPLGETELASGSDVNGSTESFEMVIEEPSMDSAVKQSLEGKKHDKWLVLNITLIFKDLTSLFDYSLGQVQCYIALQIPLNI